MDIFVLRHTDSGLLWRPKCSGYTDDILSAGFYTADEVPRVCSPDHSKPEPAGPLLEAAAVRLADAGKRYEQAMGRETPGPQAEGGGS